MSALKRREEACETLQQAHSLAPNNPDVLFVWGHALTNLDKYEAAIAKFKRADQLRPNHADTLYEWGAAIVNAFYAPGLAGLGEEHLARGDQMKEAYNSSCSVKSAGKLIHRLFHQAFRIGKLVRTNTEMSKGACSVAGAAVALLKSRLDKEARPSVLFIGVNRMIKLAASNFSRLHHGDLLFANRTAERAVEFSAQSGGSLSGRIPFVFKK